MTVITNQGKSLLATALANKQSIDLKYLYLSDSKDVRENLINTPSVKHIQEINNVYVSNTDKNVLIAEAIIPASVGGFFINSLGLYTADKKLFAVASFPSTYKSNDTNILQELALEFSFVLDNAKQVAITFNKDYILATTDYVAEQLIKVDTSISKNTKLISDIDLKHSQALQKALSKQLKINENLKSELENLKEKQELSNATNYALISKNLTLIQANQSIFKEIK